jgi:L-rhamnose mutarotase
MSDTMKKYLKPSGITNLEIYRIGTRMFMILEASDDFTFEKKGAMDALNPDVQAWKALMWQFQKPLAEAKEGEKWLFFEQNFSPITHD